MSLDQIKEYLETNDILTKIGKSVWIKLIIKNMLCNEGIRVMSDKKILIVLKGGVAIEEDVKKSFSLTVFPS